MKAHYRTVNRNSGGAPLKTTLAPAVGRVLIVGIKTMTRIQRLSGHIYELEIGHPGLFTS